VSHVAVRVNPNLHLEQNYHTLNGNFDNYDLSNYKRCYQLLKDNLGDELIQLSYHDNKSTYTVKLKSLKNYFSKFYQLHSLILEPYCAITRELYFLHETAKALDQFNNKVLNLSNQKFRARILYPNIIYLLIRMCPHARNFLQTTIKKVYRQINNSSNALIFAHVSSLYLDEEVIKTDILYEFLGNGLKKLDPLQVHNLHGFYIRVFQNIFYYYFKKEQQVHASMHNVWDMQYNLDTNMSTSSARLTVYKDVLFDIQIKRIYKRSPTISQICYNFSIFRNIVLNNELQSMYFSKHTDSTLLDNSEYKLLKFYDNDRLNEKGIMKLKELPLVYQLLRCIHIKNPTAKAYNEMLIKPEVVREAVVDELMYPFKNFFHENVLHDIINKIATNFTTNLLTGEYINPLTLATIKINQISFIIQLKKFINFCLTGD